MIIDIKKINDLGHTINAANISIDELKFILYALTNYDNDLRIYDLENKIENLIYKGN